MTLQGLMQREVLESFHLDDNYIFSLLRAKIIRCCARGLTTIRIGSLQFINLRDCILNISGSNEIVIFLDLDCGNDLIIQESGTFCLHKLICNSPRRIDRIGRKSKTSKNSHQNHHHMCQSCVPGAESLTLMRIGFSMLPSADQDIDHHDHKISEK
ncbi:hypothetical protein D3C75_445270 [compost metagenome]